MTSILLGNKILAAAEQKIESQLTTETRANYNRIVVAGMATALHGGLNSIVAGLANSKKPIEDCAKGAVNLCLLLHKQSRGTMPLKAMVPAATTLMIKALDTADKAGIVKIGTAELVEATHIVTDLIFKSQGISKEMLHTAAGKLHAVTQDPGQMEKIKRAAGVVKDPGASTPTLMPETE